MKILAIESTCDETAAAVVDGDVSGVRVIKNIVASSVQLQAKYGGIVPEIAAREQIRSIIPVLRETIAKNEIEDIDAIAVSYGPGLIGSLLVGIETARTLSFSWNKPLIKVNHIEAHLAANWILDGEKISAPKLPAIGLIISGGHTDIVKVSDFTKWDWIGGTVDDAVGEAFDKVARVLGLPYPGGPSIQKVAEEETDNNAVMDKLPRPMINDKTLKMSFSGLKAAVAKLANRELSRGQINYIARDFNEAIADVLVKKISTALDDNHSKSLLVAGGVAANAIIRKRLQEMSTEKDVHLYLPELKYCGDNAAMVGAAAVLKPDYIKVDSLGPNPSLML